MTLYAVRCVRESAHGGHVTDEYTNLFDVSDAKEAAELRSEVERTLIRNVVALEVWDLSEQPRRFQLTTTMEEVDTLKERQM